jgi:hypothetical protein
MSEENAHKKDIYDKFDFMGVSIQNSIPVLQDGVKVHKRALKGSISFYHLKVQNYNDILLTLNVEGLGDSDIYVNPGKYNFPSSDNYFKRSNGLSDDELTLTKQDHIKNFGEQKNGVDQWYTVGIYTFNTCDFDLLVLQNKYKVIKSYPGKLYTLTASRQDPVIFEFKTSSYADT